MAIHAKPITFYKRILFIVLLCLIIFTLLFIYKNEFINLFYKPNIVSETSNNENPIQNPTNTSSDASSENAIKTVVGAEYLEISVFSLDCLSNESEVIASIKNNSSEIHNNLNILITFLDENNNIVTTLTCPIKSIKPNETKHTYGIVNLDLSNCTNYEVSLLNK